MKQENSVAKLGFSALQGGEDVKVPASLCRICDWHTNLQAQASIL